MNSQSETLDSLRARLEQLEVDSKRSVRVQTALYKVAEAASASEDMQHFYAALHATVGGLMYAGNFFIAVLDEQSGMVSWPYHVDEKDLAEEVWEPEPLAEDRGTTGYVIRTGKSLHGATEYEPLIESGEVQVVGTRSLDAIFVPLRQGSAVLGALGVQSYTDGIGYTAEDVQVLTFVASHIAAALTRARALEETRQRNAELAIINSVQEGLASKLEFGSIIDLVGDKVGETFKSDTTYIFLYDRATQVIDRPYYVERGHRHELESLPLGGGFASLVINSRKPLLIGTGVEGDALNAPGSHVSSPDEEKDLNETYLGVPIIAGGEVIGVVSVQSYQKHAYDESHVGLLQTLANAMSVALENARLFDETQRLFKAEQQRAAELAIVNSVQAGLARQLSLQGIYDLVGDKLLEIFNVQNVSIVSYDTASGNLTDRYSWEKGDRTLVAGLIPLFGFRKHVVHSRQSMLLNRGVLEAAEKYANPILHGAPAKSCIFVPMLVGERVTGVVSLQDMDREDAFSESDVRLLETVTGALSVALENARLFDETQRLLKETDQRAAELAIINSVQAALAAKLDIQGIYDAVGERVSEIFQGADVGIRIYDPATNMVAFPYSREHGKPLHIDPLPLTGVTEHVFKTRSPLLVNRNLVEETAKLGSRTLPGTQTEKSGLWVPIMVGGEARGLVELLSLDREDAFTDSDVRLLTTVANAMSVALENARLFDETQRLLKETELRAAELQIINSVQEGLATKLELQAMYDLVGDKIREIFDAQIVNIRVYDAAIDTMSYPYVVQRGERVTIVPTPVNRKGLSGEILRTGKPLLLDHDLQARAEALGSVLLAGYPAWPKTWLGVPILTGGQTTGIITIENFDSEYAYAESDVNLLSTLAASMGVALENARLFKAEQQRAAELAIINSVQAGLASKMEMQSIYDLVGEQLRETFSADAAFIAVLDETHKRFDFPYYMDSGQRLSSPPLLLGRGLTSEVFTSRAPLMLNSKAEMGLHDSVTDAYEAPTKDLNQSFLGVPVLLGDRVSGVVSVQSHRANAYAENDMRLLQTLANSMSVALESARLFDETQRLLKVSEQRAAELAIINSVQEGLASKLEYQGVIDLVGDKLRELFKTNDMSIRLYDEAADTLSYPYSYDGGVRDHLESQPLGQGLTAHIIRSRQALVINRDLEQRMGELGSRWIGNTSTDFDKSFMGVPILVANRAIGIVALGSKQEEAFSEVDARLLQTITNSMGVALENARLFDETQRLLKETEQRAAELASISTVSQALVAEAELDKMIQLIGTQLLGIFKPDVAYVALLDRAAGSIQFPFSHGDEFPAMPYGQGLSTRIIDSQQPLLINKDIGKKYEELGTVRLGKVQASSYLGVPILAGGEAIGVISVQSTRQENAFSEDDSRLLSTIAANAGAAIQTARLHTETQRRAQEMATLAEIGNDIAGTRELEPVLERIIAHAMSIMNVRDIAITLRDDDVSDFRAPVALGRYADEMKGMIVRPGVGIMGSILASGQAEFVNDPQNDARRVTVPGTPEVEEDPECLMGAPLISRGIVIGGLMVWRLRRNGLFTQAELDFLVSVARQTTIAIESARLYLETQRRANEMSALAEVGREISASLEKTAVLELIVGRAMELLAAENSAVYVMEPDGKSMRAIAVRGDAVEALRADTIELGAGIIGSLASQGSAEFINDVFHDPRGIVVPGMKEAETERLMAAPLMQGEALVGMLAVWRTTAPFNQSDLNFLIGLARQAAIAFENARLFDEIKRQGAYLETIFLNSPVAIVTVDEHDRVMSWSPAAEKLFGYTSAEVMGQNVDQLVANEELIRAEAVSYSEQGKHNQYVHRVTRRTRKDGTLVDVDLSALPLPLEGGKTGVVAIYNDVGEIQRQRKYYEAIVQNSPVAIVTIDQNARVLSWNPGAETLFGYPRDEAIGENLDDLVAGTDDTHQEAESYNLLARSRELHVITNRTRKDGTPVEVELAGVPLPLPTGESGLVAIYHDITELQRARQEAVAANEAKSAFLATMSHEIRTPMNAVIGMSGLLMDTPLNPEQRDYAETIRNSGDALLTIINDILDFSKIEAGKMDLESQPFDLRECVESAMDLVANRANEKRLDLAYIIEDDVPPGVRGDVTRLRQILLNLVSNAVKFTAKGEVVLTVAAGKAPEQVLFSVRDSGIGIPKNRMGRLFTSFSQADSSTTRRFGGTGLGLAISKRLAEMMGGRMWAESEGAGKGATFAFTIQAPAVKVAARKTVRELNGIQPSLNGKQVLIVDDNATNRRILTLQTAKWGMTPRDTASPLEALRLLRGGAAVDLAILDVQMPEMDGVTLAREVRKLKGREDLALILLTSLGRKEAGAEDLEVAAFLTKPLKPSSLFDALVGIFGQHVVSPRAASVKAVIDVDFASTHPMRILLAEDNAVNQKLALRLLEQMGYRADVASNGLEAVESVERQAYDLVLMDVQMPEMDGLDATRAIRKLTSLRQPRIIAMTANAMQGDREMCLAAGMDDYVSKPIRVAELMEALSRVPGSASKRPAPSARKARASTARPATAKKGRKARAKAPARGQPRRAAKSKKK